MKTIDDIVQYAKDKGFNENSRVLNVTHSDLDGMVSTINLKKIVKEENFFYVKKNYMNVNDFFNETLFKDNCLFKNIDFVIITDLSVTEDIVEEFEHRQETLIILDHHNTAYELNKFENCFVDETETKSGADVTLEFIKGLGYNKTDLDRLNKIATQFDLFTFKNDECRNISMAGRKRSFAELLNTISFWLKDDVFIERWKDGWGKGFNKDEIQYLKDNYQRAEAHIQKVENSTNLKAQLDKKKILILSQEFLNHVSDYYLDDKGNDMVLMLKPENGKISGRVNDNSNIDIGKIFQLIRDKYDYIESGGGHPKAGGCHLKDLEKLDFIIEMIVKLSDHFDK